MFVQKETAATIDKLVKALLSLLKVEDHTVNIRGRRQGEKLYETLLTREEMAHAYDLGGYYQVPPDNRDLNYGKFVDKGEKVISGADDYHSHNTERLDVDGMKNLLLKLDFIRDIVGKG